MPAVSLVPSDLAPFATIEEEKAQAMIDDALALAARVAPCILTEEFEHSAAALAILRGAVLRWNDSGSGAAQSQTAGPFWMQIDTRQQRRGMFWPSEIEQLQSLCADSTTGRAYEVDTAPAGAGVLGVDYWWATPTDITAL